MYSKDKKEIRTGLINFIGALLDASNLSAEAARHDIVAVLCEEILRLAKDKEHYNLYILKPLFKANLLILQEWINEIRTTLETTAVTDDLMQQLQKLLKAYLEMEFVYQQIIENTDTKDDKINI